MQARMWWSPAAWKRAWREDVCSTSPLHRQEDGSAAQLKNHVKQLEDCLWGYGFARLGNQFCFQRLLEVDMFHNNKRIRIDT